MRSRRRMFAPDSDTGSGAPTTDPPATDHDAGGDPVDDGQDKPALQAARREAAANRKRAESAEARLKELEDANLSDQEKVRKRAEELEAQSSSDQQVIRSLRLELAVAKAAPGMGIIDAESAVALIDTAAVEFSKDGAPVQKTVEAALKELVQRKPFLVRHGSADGGAASGDDGAAADMNTVIRRMAGRAA